VLKAWSFACGIIGRWWNLQEVGLSKRKLGYWVHDFEEDMRPQPLFFLSFCFSNKKTFLLLSYLRYFVTITES
jgi:hypothetical protein